MDTIDDHTEGAKRSDTAFINQASMKSYSTMRS